MTPKEFKAWFDGFTEGISSLPNEKQWDRIKARVAEIDGTPTSYPVYVDRYWKRDWYPYWSAAGTGTPLVAYSSAECSDGQQSWNATSAEPLNFDSVRAMYAAGKAESELT